VLYLPDEFYDHLFFDKQCEVWRARLHELQALHFMNAHFFTHWAADVVEWEPTGCKHGQFYFFASNN